MTLRWSLFARVAAVAAILLLTTQLFLVALYISNRGPGAEPGYRFPLPERIVAMVNLFESGADATPVLSALNGPDLVVTLSDAPVEDEAIPETRLPRVERQFARYTEALGDRPYAAFIAIPDQVLETEIRLQDRTIWSTYPLRMAIGLADGRTLVIETRDDLVTQVYSVPVGFWSGIFGLISAVIVLLVLRRETAPLRDLVRATEAFSEQGVQTPVTERGAPELRDLIVAFNRMQARIGDLLEARRVMLGAIGHDLRTYLTRFQLKADAAGVDSLMPDIAHMAAILENCLALANDPGASGPAEHIDVTALIRDLSADYAQSGVDISTHTDEGDLWICGERLSIERALRDLIDNAVLYGDKPALSAASKAGSVEITVRDLGPGIAPEDIERLQKPFERGNEARTIDGGGSGLGLTIAKALTERNRGTLVIAANEPTGLRVSLTFPALKDRDTAPGA